MTDPRVIERVLAAVGVLALLLLTIGAVATGIAIRRGFSAREQPSALEAWAARAVREASIPSRARTLRNPLEAGPDVLAAARAHWADHCATCHANDGGGQTPLGGNMFPKPPDMRRSPSQDLTDGELYWIIKNGIRLTGMPAWGDPGDDDRDTWGLVTFIRHLPSLTAQEVEEMKRLNPKSAHELEEERQEEEFLREQDGRTGEKP